MERITANWRVTFLGQIRNIVNFAKEKLDIQRELLCQRIPSGMANSGTAWWSISKWEDARLSTKDAFLNKMCCPGGESDNLASILMNRPLEMKEIGTVETSS